MYTGRIQWAPKAPLKNKEKHQKMHPLKAQQDPIQSTKSTIEEGPRAINKLDHAQRLHKKFNLIL